ncbi:MAG: PQQ-like beta-propeller repeat protein, partial [Candidatus Altiarchaeota archaeon]|nr:PQQ-like beta-propeller repeat protein [Candidatus Altiarchaeota archaeon]
YVGSEQYPHGPAKAMMEVGAKLYAMNPDGTEKWHIEYPISGISVSPAISYDGTLYSSGYDQSTTSNDGGAGILYALNQEDGSTIWEFRFEAWQESSPAITSDGTIYIGSKEGKVYVIEKDGTKRWDFDTGDGVSAIPLVDEKTGDIYIGSWNAYMYKLDQKGKELWRFKTPDAFEGVSSSAVMGSEGTIYFGSNGGYFYSLYPNGTEKWKFQGECKSCGILTTPAIGRDGTVYVGSWDGYLYAFGGKEVEEPKIVEEDTQPLNETLAVNETVTTEVEEPKSIFSKVFDWIKNLFNWN